MEQVQSIKQRFELIGNNAVFNRAIEKAIRVAPTDISVLVTGESGVGKESIPKIIHALSQRKHNKYIAVNCGAIPEGTIDSELFGHEKGSFTGATQTRSGYFEVADGGTIFLDEVGELPLPTQVRLLRVLENGEFLKVGSSKVQKTDVRIVAATNVNIIDAIKNEKFREDLYYRLSTVEINLPPLRERKDDIHLLFRKFAADFAEKYRMPAVRLTDDAVQLLKNNFWSGNIRQLRNVAEQLSVLEQSREINAENLRNYLPQHSTNLPSLYRNNAQEKTFENEREILYKVLFDMKNDLNDLKKVTAEILQNAQFKEVKKENRQLLEKLYGENNPKDYKDIIDNAIEISEAYADEKNHEVIAPEEPSIVEEKDYDFVEDIEEEESLSLQEKEVELIKKSLEKYNGKRKEAAKELGISERTLYRKIKHYDL